MEPRNEAIKISTDAMLALVVAEAERREMAKLPSLEEMNAAFHPSAQFQKKMDRLMRRVRHKKARRLCLAVAKYVAFFLMGALTLFVCAAIPVNAVENDHPMQIEWNDEYIELRMKAQGTGQATLPPDIEFGYIPEGFVLQTSGRSPNHYYAHGACEDNFIDIQIWTLAPSDNLVLDNKTAVFHALRFDGHDAIWGASADRDADILLWREDDFFFYITGRLELKELIRIAENITL